ncbi:hypothetical protein PT273_08610 [Orbaceae bacterium ESL0727]|nr:hypothetical protein [Orbaceae bacterium ESL0727]
MAIKWNKFPETEPQKDGPWIEPCLVVVKYESNNEKYELFGTHIFHLIVIMAVKHGITWIWMTRLLLIGFM